MGRCCKARAVVKFRCGYFVEVFSVEIYVFSYYTRFHTLGAKFGFAMVADGQAVNDFLWIWTCVITAFCENRESIPKYYFWYIFYTRLRKPRCKPGKISGSIANLFSHATISFSKQMKRNHKKKDAIHTTQSFPHIF